MTLNIGLAFYYWNGRIAVASVALQYSKISDEPWRFLTGSTAHFELWHLFFNMQALYSLGMELEGTVYTSMEFFLYNCSFLMIVPAIWCGLETMRRKLSSSSVADIPTVGFSGVLFAWMLLASVKQSRTCPVFFLPQLCFDTHYVAGLPWNVGPLVQVVVAQVLLPRVSLTGHLAGLIAGMLVHAGCLPLRLVQPSLLFPAGYTWFLWGLPGGNTIPERVWWHSVLRWLILVASSVVLGCSHPQTLGYLATVLYWQWTRRNSHPMLLTATGCVALVNLVTTSLCCVEWTVVHAPVLVLVLAQIVVMLDILNAALANSESFSTLLAQIPIISGNHSRCATETERFSGSGHRLGSAEDV